MRLRTCLGGLVLVLGACAGLTSTIPGDVRIDVDGSSLVFKKKPEPAAPVPPAPAPEAPPAPDAPQG